jgi:glycosyltransferase involved in cell wall biosynthesis
MNKIKILYLYSELMGYQLPIFKEYVSSFGAEVHVMHWDHKKLTPFVIPSINGVSYYKRSEYTLKQLKEFLLKTNPDIIYTSGWMDIGYLKAIRPLRKKGVPVVTGFDDIWFKTFRQKVASIIFPLIKPFFFSHAWVAGPYQYEFAKRLEFKNNEIIFNCLSADLDIFNQVYNQKNKIKKRNFPHKFLYVGRFESVKGVDILIEAWNNLTSSNLTKDWTLTLIGSGSLVLEDLMINDSIIIKPFLQPEKLVQKNRGLWMFCSAKS